MEAKRNVRLQTAAGTVTHRSSSQPLTTFNSVLIPPVTFFHPKLLLDNSAILDERLFSTTEGKD